MLRQAIRNACLRLVSGPILLLVLGHAIPAARAQCEEGEACEESSGQREEALLPLPQVEQERRPLEDEFTGFTIDNTITRMGHEFAREVADYRNAVYPDSDYNVTIFERPSAVTGSLVWVEYDFTTIVQMFIQPNTDLRELARQVVPVLENQIQQRRLQNQLNIDQDLAPPEL